MMRPFEQLAACSLLMAVVAALHVPATPSNTTSVDNLDTSISAVKSGGYWEQDGRHGTYRIVIVNKGWEHVRCDVWIQWIEEVASDETLRLLSSVPIREIQDQGWSLGPPEMLLSKVPTRVRLEGTHSQSLEKTVFMLTLARPGEYRFEKNR